MCSCQGSVLFGQLDIRSDRIRLDVVFHICVYVPLCVCDSGLQQSSHRVDQLTHSRWLKTSSIRPLCSIPLSERNGTLSVTLDTEQSAQFGVRAQSSHEHQRGNFTFRFFFPPFLLLFSFHFFIFSFVSFFGWSCCFTLSFLVVLLFLDFCWVVLRGFLLSFGSCFFHFLSCVMLLGFLLLWVVLLFFLVVFLLLLWVELLFPLSSVGWYCLVSSFLVWCCVSTPPNRKRKNSNTTRMEGGNQAAPPN